MSVDVARAVAAAGGRYGSMLLFLLLWVFVGALFVMVAFRDRRPPSQPGSHVPKLPAPRHPLRMVHTALVSARQARRRAAAKDAARQTDEAGQAGADTQAAPDPARSPPDGHGPRGSAGRPPVRKQRKGSHLRKVE